MFDPRHAVYSVKGVAAIPLVEDRARAALISLAARANADARSSLLPPSRPETPPLTEDGESSALFSAGSALSKEAASPHVKFATEPQVKVMTPQTAQEFEAQDEGSPPSPASSAASTPSSEYSLNTDHVVKTLTARLSFWSRMSKRPSTQKSEPRTSQDSQASDSDPDIEQRRMSLDAVIKDGKAEPSQIIDSILETNAPPPPTAEQKNSELEDKIVRECVREFTRGGMYFAYAFGTSSMIQGC